MADPVSFKRCIAWLMAVSGNGSYISRTLRAYQCWIQTSSNSSRPPISSPSKTHPSKPSPPSFPLLLLPPNSLLPQNLTSSHKPTQTNTSAHSLSKTTPFPKSPLQPKKNTGNSKSTYIPPAYPPNPFMLSACTAVIRSKFSKSDIFAVSCASCAWRWESWRDLVAVVVAAGAAGGAATEARDCVRVWVIVPGVRVGFVVDILLFCRWCVVAEVGCEEEDVLLMFEAGWRWRREGVAEISLQLQRPVLHGNISLISPSNTL